MTRVPGAALAGLLVLVLAACAPDLDSPEARRTVANDDSFLPYHQTLGAEIRYSPGLLSDRWQTLRLQAHRDRKTGVLTTLAHVRIGYTLVETLRYENARNERAEALTMHLIARDGTGCRRQEGCPHIEEFLVVLPEAELRQAQQKGYMFKMFARRGGEVLFAIPPALIQSLFKAVEAAPPVAEAPRKG